MSCFERVDVPVSRRRAARRPSSESGSAISLEGSRSVVVEDLGCNGARIRGHKLPGIGKQVLIWTEGLDVLGSVVWARFGVRGVEFDTMPDAATQANPSTRLASGLGAGS